MAKITETRKNSKGELFETGTRVEVLEPRPSDTYFRGFVGMLLRFKDGVHGTIFAEVQYSIGRNIDVDIDRLRNI